jgi:hypothetical protein
LIKKKKRGFLLRTDPSRQCRRHPGSPLRGAQDILGQSGAGPTYAPDDAGSRAAGAWIKEACRTGENRPGLADTHHASNPHLSAGDGVGPHACERRSGVGEVVGELGWVGVNPRP